MFPSSNNGSDPMPHSDQQVRNRAFFNDIIPNSKQEDSPLCFFHLPSPYIPCEVELHDHDVFLQQNNDFLLNHQPLRAIGSTVSQAAFSMADCNKNDVIELSKICNNKSYNSTEKIPRKISSKRDRHSKINTAQGPRDRRMRLSLKVARDFFDLQDRLGFDKASKTVEWLLVQAKAEIKKVSSGLIPKTNYSLSFGTKSASSTSDCEAVSGLIDEEASIKGSISKNKPSQCVNKEKRTRSSRKAAFHPRARESRERARARARERTREKMWNRRLDESRLCEEVKSRELSQLGCCSPFGTGEESGTQGHSMNLSSMEVLAEVEALSSKEQEQLGTPEAMVDGSLIMGTSATYHHLYDIPQEHQFTDIQPFYGTWEAYNIHSLC